jgi:hypothetical protein
MFHFKFKTKHKNIYTFGINHGFTYSWVNRKHKTKYYYFPRHQTSRKVIYSW